MRKSLFFLAVLAGSFSCLSAQAQNTQPANYGVSFAKNYQENDVYHLEVKRARREGYALQVASFSSYTNVIKYATQLQGKWFRNLLLRTDYSADSKNIYKVLIGPFPDKNTAVSYQQFAKKKNIDGFIVSLRETPKPSTTVISSANPIVSPPSAPSVRPPVTLPTTPAKRPQEMVPKIIQTGEASYYHKKFHGRTTAYGEKYDRFAFTAAHWTLPYNSKVKVCRLDNQKCVEVRINDRGPNPTKAIARNGQPRIIDLSTAAARQIDLIQSGITQVSIELLN